ncbi:MAG: cobalt ECF transporter T component CbiQ [Thermosynechococcaceae cyanobacterium]
MLHEIDRYVHLDSWMHRWQARPKLVGLGTLIFAFAMVEDLRLLPAMLGVTAVLYAIARLPLSFLLHHLRYPGFFILGVVTVLPLVSGNTILWQWGSLAIRAEGLATTLLIVCRFLSILTLGLIILGTCPFSTTIKAMRSFGLPSILTDMMLLSYRYLFEFAQMLTTMQQAMRLRGFHAPPLFAVRRQWGHLQRLASLMGTMLIRSYEQAVRSYQAMGLRGYGQPSASSPCSREPATFWNSSALVVMLMVAAGFVISDFLWTA